LTDFRRNIQYFIKRDNLQIWEQSNTRRYKNHIIAPDGFVLVSTGTPWVNTELSRQKGDRKEPFLERVFNLIKDGVRPADQVDNINVKE
jgi:hypothetical protein